MGAGDEGETCRTGISCEDCGFSNRLRIGQEMSGDRGFLAIVIGVSVKGEYLSWNSIRGIAFGDRSLPRG
jgi:hypothetical protein